MRDSEDRTRHFIVKNKKGEFFEEPSHKHRSDRFIESEDYERNKDSDDDSSARAGFFARYGQKGRDNEEETECRPRKAPYNRDRNDYDEFADEGDDKKKAPLLVRIFAWIALLAIFFACGYLGANYFFNWADKKGGQRVGNVVGSSSEIRQIQQGETDASTSGNVKYKIYIPEDGNLTTRDIDIKKGMPEEDIEEVISMYVDGLKETKMLDTGVHTLNIFRSGDWLYLDMTGSFQKSLKTLGKQKAELVITGLVRTMQENFPPIKKIKFYIDGKESSSQTPVDLTKPWEINK